MPRNTTKKLTLPQHPHIATRLYLRRLEAQGIDAVQKLTTSHWEVIQKLEAGTVSAPRFAIGGAR